MEIENTDELRLQLNKAIDFIRSEGYRRCDVAACNCGSWHGGHAFARLRDWSELLEGMEISTNGKTLLQATSEALKDREKLHATLDAVEAAIDPQIYPETVAAKFDATDDAEVSVNITFGLWRKIGKALNRLLPCDCKMHDGGCMDLANCFVRGLPNRLSKKGEST